MEFLTGMWRGWFKKRWLVCAVMLLCPALCGAQQAPTEADIQAAYIFNFAKFVEWPAGALASTNSPIRIGVLGDAPRFSAALKKSVSGKKIDAHPVELEFYDELPETPPQILFVATDRQLKRLLARVEGKPVLTVGEMENFCESGGVINFKTVNSRVRFEINPKAAEKQKLKLSSKLLSVAVRLVETETEP